VSVRSVDAENDFHKSADRRKMRCMKAGILTPTTESAIWARIVDPETGDLSRATAQALLQLDFPSDDRLRMDELAAKASAGTLTRGERRNAETYNRVAHLLALLQSKARQTLRAKKGR
jgi:hypothetical protein